MKRKKIDSHWDRNLWAIQLTSANNLPKIIGSLLHKDAVHVGSKYKGEPTRPLLFCTRKQARAYCSETNKAWSTRADCVFYRWNVRPLKVRETFNPVE
jgi:hypothetical protein